MILQTPASVVKFFRQFVPHLTEFAPSHVAAAVPSVVAGIALTVGHRHSLSGIGKEVYAETRDKSTMSRMLNCHEFKSREIHWGTIETVLREVAPRTGESVKWHLGLDGTSVLHGAHTRILGAILPKMRPEKAAKLIQMMPGSKKGRRTKYHTFLLGTLTTHEGVRIPLPRMTCDPKSFKRRGGQRKVRLTQLDLAKVMIGRLLPLLPKGVQLVVTADSYFESEKLMDFARQRHFVFISPIDSNRCFADEETPTESNGQRIEAYGLRLPFCTFSRLDLRRGSEETACYRRYSERKPGAKDRRTYLLRHEERTVARLGTVGLVYSWKTPVFEPRRSFRKMSFKVLVCSDPTWSAPMVVEWYELRWTSMEIVIRELKQHLGFEDFTGGQLEALERYIDLVLLTFLCLELHRVSLLNEAAACPRQRRRIVTARTLMMQTLLREEANRELLAETRRCFQKNRLSPLLAGYLAATTASPTLPQKPTKYASLLTPV